MNDSSMPPNSASRKHPTANLARGIEELDGVGALAIAKRTNSQDPGSAHTGRQTSPSAATLGAAQSTESSSKSISKSGGVEVNDSLRPSSLRPSSQASRSSRVSVRPRPSGRPVADSSLWPQWLFAAAVLGAALWYLFSVEPRSEGRSLEVERRALSPQR